MEINNSSLVFVIFITKKFELELVRDNYRDTLELTDSPYRHYPSTESPPPYISTGISSAYP